MTMFEAGTAPGRPARAFLVAAVASFGAVLGIGTALGAGGSAAGDPAIEGGVERPGMYPATPRVVVDSGRIPGIGRYELLHARDVKGRPCVGLLLKGQAADGSDVLSEGCGGPEDLNIGRVTAGDGSWTILHGKAPPETTRVRAQVVGGQALDLHVVDDGASVLGTFTVQKVEGNVELNDLELEAFDAAGRTLASQRPSRGG